MSITVDPDLLRGVDAYVAEHEGLDRSKVIEQALELWTAAQQDAAMEAQYSSGEGNPEEIASWRSMRRAAAASRLARR